MSARDNKHARPRFFDLTRLAPDLHQEDEWDGDPRFAPFPKLSSSGDLPMINTEDGADEGNPRFASYPTPRHNLEDLFPNDIYVGLGRHDLKIVSEDVFQAVQKMRAREFALRRGGHRHD